MNFNDAIKLQCAEKKRRVAMFDAIGKVLLKNPLRYTTYWWGDYSDIAGKEVALLEKNKQGNCLCFTIKGLIDVDKRDVVSIKEEPVEKSFLRFIKKNYPEAFKI